MNDVSDGYVAEIDFVRELEDVFRRAETGQYDPDEEIDRLVHEDREAAMLALMIDAKRVRRRLDAEQRHARRIQEAAAESRRRAERRLESLKEGMRAALELASADGEERSWRVPGVGSALLRRESRTTSVDDPVAALKWLIEHGLDDSDYVVRALDIGRFKAALPGIAAAAGRMPDGVTVTPGREVLQFRPDHSPERGGAG